MAMAGFIRWVAADHDQITRRVATRSSELRNELALQSSHKRTPDAIASLLAGLEVFFDFTVDVGALTRQDADGMLSEGRQALVWIGDQQQEFQRIANPVERFVDLLNMAIESGEAYVTDVNGRIPFDTTTFKGHRQLGWELDTSKSESQWIHKGRHVGWLDHESDELYLAPSQTDAAIRKCADQAKRPLSIGRDTLWRRLKESGLLIRWDDDRCTTRVDVGIQKDASSGLPPVSSL